MKVMKAWPFFGAEKYSVTEKERKKERKIKKLVKKVPSNPTHKTQQNLFTTYTEGYF